MANPIPQVVTEDRASGAQFIDGSLNFDSGSSHYLNRTPSSTGNRRTWTWSGWVKFANIDKNDQVLFSAVTGSSYIHFRFMGVDSTNSRSHKLNFQMYDGSTAWNLYTRRVLRDSGWYHLLLQVDYTQATAADRTKIYINGELTDQVGVSNSDSASFAAQNYETYANLSGAVNNIGYHSSYGEYFDGELSNVYLIDGLALEPTEFGFTDPLTNTWRPKKYTGTYGTNGFYLPMDGNSPIGQDKSGNGNDFTPVNFGGSVALDNPQANGALPILNTDGSGKTARPGTRTDANASNLVLAVPLVGSAQDVHHIVKGSGSAKTITNTGATNTTVSNFYGGSFDFDGTDDRLDFDLATGGFGSGDFTLEYFFYQDTLTNYQTHFGVTRGTTGFNVGTQAAGNVVFYDSNGGGSVKIDTGAGKVVTGRWYHVAFVRSGSTITAYLDGVSFGTYTSSVNYSGTDCSFGSIENGGEYTNGKFSDLRIYVGVAKYTSDFVVPSTNPDILPETPSGITGKTNLAKITEGAVAFRGTNDRLDVPKSTDFDFPGEFTMEGWIYANSLPTGSDDYSEVKTIFESIDWNSQLGQYQFGISNDNRVQFYVYNNANTYIKGTTTLGIRRWYHLAVSRDSSNDIRLFVNGILETTSNNSYSLSNSNQPNPARIGRTKISSNFKSLDGFISNVRVIKGTALYTSNFTPPTEPLTEVTNTKLLCCQSPTSVTAAAVGSINDQAGGGYAFTNAKTYSVYNGGGRAANYTVQWSDDNSNWTTAWSGNMSNNSSCGLQQGTGSGNPGPHQYWRYVEGSSTNGHHPRVSRIVLNDGTTDVNIRVYTSDNCSDSGDYVIGTTSTYTDPTYNDTSTAKATKFNPFNTDINTVRGQETGYATLNPLDKGSSSTLSDGNLRFAGVSSAHRGVRATIKPTVKIYAEMIISDNETGIGFASSFVGLDNSTLVNGKWVVYNNQLRSNGSSIASITTLGVGEIIQVAYDPVSTASWIGRNNKWYDSSGTFTGNPATGANPTFYIPDAFIYVHSYNAYVVDANFGQKPFKFPPPDGFQPLSLSNAQPENVIARPDKYVKATTYTGDGNTSGRSINIGFRPDLIWLKSRGSGNHGLYDSVRGPDKRLQADGNAAEDTVVFPGASNFGFDFGSETYYNGTSTNYVAWTWKAGGSKGTFNVDDVGYANASDVNMSVGSLNSSAYDQRTTWTNGLTANDRSFNSSYPATQCFDGNKSTFGSTGGSGGGNSSGTIDLGNYFPASNGPYRVVLNATSSHPVCTINGVQNDTTLLGNPAIRVWTSVPSVPSIVMDNSGAFGCSYIEINGKILVDSGVSVTNVPSMAPTGCSVGTKQGFSILKYQGNGTAGASIAHGLSEAPKLMIHKSIDQSRNWYTITTVPDGQTRYAYMNTTKAITGSAVAAPTSSLMYFTSSAESNTSGENYIVYMWHDVPGLQKFGTYEGNTTQGEFIELGFRPAIIMLKSFDQTWYWNIHDSKRSPINPGEGNFLRPDNNSVEGTASGNNNIDFLSNGFKIRSTTAQSEPTNVNGQTYFYAAWAEAPSINLYGAQANAR